MGSKELRKRNRHKVENNEEEQSVKHKNKVEKKGEEHSVKHKKRVEKKEEEHSVKHTKPKEHDCSKRRKTSGEDYYSWGHDQHIGQMGHDTSHMKTREHHQHTLTENSESKDRSHWSHNGGKSHEQHCDNRRKHSTSWNQEEFMKSTRKGYIRNERSTDWGNDRWCPEKLTPERGDTKGIALSTMNDNTFRHITTDRWYPERYEKEDQWPSYNKEVEKVQKQQQSVDMHRHKGAAAVQLAEKSLTLSELEYSTEYDSRVHGWIKANPDYASETCGQSLHEANT